MADIHIERGAHGVLTKNKISAKIFTFPNSTVGRFLPLFLMPEVWSLKPAFRMDRALSRLYREAEFFSAFWFLILLLADG
jgi:hypothetical protein